MWCAKAANIVHLASAVLDVAVSADEDRPVIDRMIVNLMANEAEALREEVEALALMAREALAKIESTE